MLDPSRQKLEFDAKAELYEANRLAPWYQAQGDHVLEHLSLQPADVVLDVGCGTGHLLRQVARTFPDVTGIGVDIAPKMIEVARRQGGRAGPLEPDVCYQRLGAADRGREEGDWPPARRLRRVRQRLSLLPGTGERASRHP
jgi:SAM-dependent methyltransferase